MQYTQAQIDRANAVSLEDFLRTQGETLIPVYRHLPQIRAVPPCGELRHLFIYEPFFLLRHIELHLNVPLSVCHGQPPFLIRVWDIPASNFDCSGKGPEQRKIRKRVLACCAC